MSDARSFRLLRGLNRLPRRWRWPLKWAILALAAFLVCYPDPRVFVRHGARWLDPNPLIEPDSPRLEPLLAEVRGRIEMVRRTRGGGLYVRDPVTGAMTEFVGPPAPQPEPDSPRGMLPIVERLVYERIPYAYDWETWGVSDYIPTLDEVLDMGREDCDGRAVVAASLLARLGYKAELVADFSHVWVKTDYGETMSPGRHSAVRATSQGVEVDWGWRLATSSLTATGYGLAVFPLGRQLIVLAVLWLLLLRPGAGGRVAAVSAMLLLNGFLLLRVGGADWQQPQRGYQSFGLLQLTVGVILLWRSGRPRRAETFPPASVLP